MVIKQSESLFRGNLVRLAGFQLEDAELLARWSEDADYMRRMDTDFAVPQTVDSHRERDQKGGRSDSGIQFRLRTLADDTLIGFVALHSIEWNNQTALLAVGIGDPDYRGKGYGADALRLILRYAFHELNLNRVGLDVISNNESAIRAYEKVGFQHEGKVREGVLRDGNKYDRLIMGILREDWEPQL